MKSGPRWKPCKMRKERSWGAEALPTERFAIILKAEGEVANETEVRSGNDVNTGINKATSTIRAGAINVLEQHWA